MRGRGYLGSKKIESSVANENIIPEPPESWSMKYLLVKFSLMNYEACTIRINEETEVFLGAGQGFNTDRDDSKIYSIEILESGIDYNWVGAY